MLAAYEIPSYYICEELVLFGAQKLLQRPGSKKYGWIGNCLVYSVIGARHAVRREGKEIAGSLRAIRYKAFYDIALSGDLHIA